MLGLFRCSGMIDRPSSLLIIVLGLFLLGPTVECCGDSEDVRRDHPVVNSADEAVRVRVASSGPSLSPTEASVLDDEVEVPDESEDEQPDDPGDAIPQKSSLSHLLLAVVIVGLEPASSSPQTSVQAGVGPMPSRPRFLSLCRILR